MSAVAYVAPSSVPYRELSIAKQRLAEDISRFHASKVPFEKEKIRKGCEEIFTLWAKDYVERVVLPNVYTKGMDSLPRELTIPYVNFFSGYMPVIKEEMCRDGRNEFPKLFEKESIDSIERKMYDVVLYIFKQLYRQFVLKEIENKKNKSQKIPQQLRKRVYTPSSRTRVVTYR